LLALAVAGCGGGGSKSFVLTQSDVGKDFREFDRGQQMQADFTPPRNDQKRFGRTGGWKARFTRPGTAATEGPLQVSSLADTFGTAMGAHQDFTLYQQALGQFVTTGGRILAAPGVGEESAAVTYKQGFKPHVFRYYVLAWRQGKVTGSVSVSGGEGKLTWAQALDLAHKQVKDIAAAS
jgi:hypothetical protein